MLLSQQPTDSSQTQQSHGMKRLKTHHPIPQQSMSAAGNRMVRSKSTSSATTSPCRFTPGSGSARPMLNQQVSLSLDTHVLHGGHQQPTAHDQFLFDPMFQGLDGQHFNPGMPPVMEDGPVIGTMVEDPAMYLQRLGALDADPNNQSVGPVFDQSFTTPAAHQPFTSYNMSPSQYGPFVPGPASSNTSMTRSNSSVTGPLQMMRLNTDSSIGDVYSSSSNGSFQGQQIPGSRKRSTPHDEQLLGMSSISPVDPLLGQQPVMDMSRSLSVDTRPSFTHTHQPSHIPEAKSRRASMQAPLMQTSTASQGQSSMQAPISCIQDGMPLHGELMLRTDSASSAKSTQSQRDRAKDSLQRQIAASNQRLAPKPEMDQRDANTAPHGQSKTEQDGKVLLHKNAYQRPRRPKIFCHECAEHPDGFRGEHELRRHHALKHSTMKQVWICIDPGAGSNLKAETPIDKCKNCQEQKEYGVYYNAAAHLRRAHFTKKTPRASRKNGIGNNGAVEKKGGKSGGEWPPMAELKSRWMKQIMVSADKVIDDGSTVSGEAGVQDPEMLEATFRSGMGGSAHFDDKMAFGVGSNANLDINLNYQADGNDMFDESFHDFPSYTTTQPTPFAPSMPSTGSAGFNYTFQTAGDATYTQDGPIDLNMFRGSQISPTSTANLHALDIFPQDSQSTQGWSQQTAMTSVQPSQQDAFPEFDFNMAIGPEC